MAREQHYTHENADTIYIYMHIYVSMPNHPGTRETQTPTCGWTQRRDADEGRKQCRGHDEEDGVADTKHPLSP